jgi:hypothetical protein
VQRNVAVVLGDVPVVTLDVEDMRLTKKTSREADTSDRLQLERLRQALRAQAAAASPPVEP